MAVIIVLDANVFAKIFVPEPDSDEAKIFLKSCASLGVRFMVPHLFAYEIAEITRYYKYPLEETRKLFRTFQRSVLSLVDPDNPTWLLAEKINASGHEKSGFPSMYDSIYHALAIRQDAVFVTADRKHYKKAKGFGHICLLKDWESLFQGGEES
jgi:predicted nucleic acid-binding protein